MHCPECHASYEAGATVCNSCGLILLSAEAPKRRAEDFASQRRRAADLAISCQFCHGEIDGKAIRCKHCGEIVNEDYYRDRAKRLRARVNYASWVAYIFGLGALLVFRPVGLLSIAAGLLLSIAYYAIPVEPPQAITGKKQSLGARLRRQLKLERVAIPIPHLKNKKLIFVGTPLVAALIGYSANVFLLQEPMNQVLRENSAFSGMQVSTHYEYWVVPGVVVYDLRDLSLRQTPIDVHTAFLEFAKKLRDRRYRRVELSYHGISKFEIDGSAFHRLGEEYARRNFDFVLYRFPRLFRSTNGKAAIPQNESDRDALLQFHRQWYGSDQMTRSVANGL
jgi:predicted nucleic acid-binding Zn ribbon protein